MAIKKSEVCVELLGNFTEEQKVVATIQKLEELIDARIKYEGLGDPIYVHLKNLPDDRVQEELVRRYKEEDYLIIFHSNERAKWIVIY